MRRQEFTLTGLATLFVFVTDAGGAGIVWEKTFEPTFAPAAENAVPASPVESAMAARSTRLAAAPNGDVYYFAHESGGALGLTTVSRLSGVDDTPVWRRSVTGLYPYSSGRVLEGTALPDGGALAVLGGAARFSPNGEMQWSRGLHGSESHTARHLRYGNGDLLAPNKPGALSPERPLILRRIDGQSGGLADAYVHSNQAPSCTPTLLAMDAADQAYVSIDCPDSSGGSFNQVLRLTASLTPQWVSADVGASAGQIGTADENGVYLHRRLADDTLELVKLAAADGSVLWSRVSPGGDLQRDLQDRIVVTFQAEGLYHIDVIAPQSGQVVWTHAIVAKDVSLAIAADGFYLAGTTTADERGFVERLDHDGVVLWHTAVDPSVPERTFRPRDLLASTAALRVSGADCLPWVECTSALVRLDRASGMRLAISYPEVAQSSDGRVIADGPDHLLAASLERTASGQQVRARRIDSAGTTVWEQVFPIDAPFELRYARVDRAGDGDLLVTAGSTSAPALPERYGYPYVAKYSASDGSRRWERVLLDPLRQYDADFRAVSDADGNVVVAQMGYFKNIGLPGYETRRFIERLDRATGQTQWTLEFRLGGASPESVPWVDMLGNDLLLGEAPLSMAGASPPMKLSGQDTSLLWSNPQLAGGALMGIDGDVGYLRLGANRLTAFSLASGGRLWEYAHDDPADISSLFSSVVVDQDVYIGGSHSTASGMFGLVIRLDRQTGAPVWVSHIDGLSQPPARQRAVVRSVDATHVHFTQSEPDSYVAAARLDRETGLFVDSSILTRVSYKDEGRADNGALPVTRLADGSLLAAGGRAHRPGHPPGLWMGRLIAPAEGIQGDLAVSMSALPAVLAPGTAFDIDVRLTYSGDAPVSDVAASLDLGSHGVGLFSDDLLIEAMTCTVNGGGSCDVVRTPGGIRARLDLAPGSEARLVTTVRAVTGDRPLVTAEACAPYGLFEPDLFNNSISTWRPAEHLFTDGFE